MTLIVLQNRIINLDHVTQVEWINERNPDRQTLVVTLTSIGESAERDTIPFGDYIQIPDGPLAHEFFAWLTNQAVAVFPGPKRETQ